MEKINLEEIMLETFSAGSLFAMKSAYTRDGDSRPLFEKWQHVIKEACKQTLELAAENAEIEVETCMGQVMAHYVDKDSILNTINQIE